MVSPRVTAANARDRNILFPRRQQRTRLGETFRLQNLVELYLRQQLFLQHEIVDTPAGHQRLLRDFGRVGVADVRVERGDDADRVLDRGAQPFAIGGNTLDAALGERQAAIGEVHDALDQAVGDDRLEGIQLQLPRLRGEAHRDVVAAHFQGDLGHDPGYHRVDLTWHALGTRPP